MFSRDYVRLYKKIRLEERFDVGTITTRTSMGDNNSDDINNKIRILDDTHSMGYVENMQRNTELKG